MSSKNVNSAPSSGVFPPHQASFRTNEAPDATSYLVSLNGPVPTGTLSRVVPAAYALGVISDWALKTDTRYGKLPFALTSVKVTVFGSVATAEPEAMTPFSPEFPAVTRRSIVATTSSAVNGVPSCQVTPWRSLKVQTLFVLSGVHDRARPGRDVRGVGAQGAQELERLGGDPVARQVDHRDRIEGALGALRGDPDRAAHDPARGGGGGRCARRGRPGSRGRGSTRRGSCGSGSRRALLQAAMTMLTDAIERPTTVARLMNSRRPIRPLAKASTVSSWSGVVSRRTLSSWE